MNYRIKLLCTLCSLLIAFNANAEEKGFYLGGSLGHSSIDTVSEGDVNAAFASVGVTTTSDVDDSDLGWKIFGGYNLNQYFGIELAYVDLGEAEINATSTAPVAGTASISAEADGFTFAGVARYPINERFDVFGKLGGFVWDVEGGGSLTVGGGTITATAEDDGTSILFGLGAEYEMGNNIGVRAEWERYEVSSDDVDLFSVGLEYDF